MGSAHRAERDQERGHKGSHQDAGQNFRRMRPTGRRPPILTLTHSHARFKNFGRNFIEAPRRKGGRLRYIVAAARRVTSAVGSYCNPGNGFLGIGRGMRSALRGAEVEIDPVRLAVSAGSTEATAKPETVRALSHIWA